MNEEKEVVETEVLESDLENEEKDEKEQSEGKKSQSREDNSKFAEIRRTKKELERVQKRNVELEQELRNLKASSIDKETLEDLGFRDVNEENYKTAKIYQDFKRNGSINPKEETYQKLYNEMVEEKKKADEEQETKKKNREIVEKDAKNLFETYKITPEEVSKDKDFMETFGSSLSYGNWTDLYGRYLALKNKFSKEIRQEQKSKGVLPNPTKVDSESKSYLDMSTKERIEFLKKQGLIR